MKTRMADPVRIADLPPEHDLARLAVLFKSTTQTPFRELPLVKRRIHSTLRRRIERRRRALRVALVGMLMFIAGVVGAVVQPMLIARIHPQAQPSPDSATPSARGARKHARFPQLAPSDAEPESMPASGDRAETVGAAEPPIPVASPASAEALVVANRVGSLATVVARKQPPRTTAPFEAFATSPGTPSAETPISPVVADTPILARRPAIAGAPVVVGTLVGDRQAVVNPPPTPPSSEAELPPSGNARALPLPPVTSASQSAAPRPSTDPLTVNPPGADPPDEQASLAKALRRLRVDRAPESALEVLDEHRARFPRGLLAPEVARLRMEALWLTGRPEAALVELDREPSDMLADRDERHVLRGELHARAGQWRLAVTDFEAALHSHPGEEVATDRTADPRLRDCIERALWGRASARSHVGDAAGARADLRDYLRRFPRGRFAAEAARLVQTPTADGRR
jgi:hypothetical protein